MKYFFIALLATLSLSASNDYTCKSMDQKSKDFNKIVVDLTKIDNKMVYTYLPTSYMTTLTKISNTTPELYINKKLIIKLYDDDTIFMSTTATPNNGSNLSCTH